MSKDGDTLKFLINLLGLTERDILRAVLSCYSPCQPGALVGSWKSRRNYGHPPTSKDLWKILRDHDFRCGVCGSQYRMAFDHKDDDRDNSDPSNFQVLCKHCNRAKGKGDIRKDTALRALEIIKDFADAGICPKVSEVGKIVGGGRTFGGSESTVTTFLLHRLAQQQAKSHTQV